MQALALVALTFDIEAGHAGHGHDQHRTIGQHLGHPVQAGGGLRAERRATGREGHRAQLLATAAPEGARQQGEGRGDGLGDQVDDDLQDHRAQAELRVVQRARDRQVDVDHAVAVGQQRHRQLDRQAGGGTFHLLAEGQLVEHDVVAGRQLAIGLHAVAHIHAELAALDAMAGVLDRIRRQRRQLQIAHLALDVQRQGLGQRIQLAEDVKRGRCSHPPAQLQVGQLGRSGGRHAGERAELAIELAQVGRIVGLDEAVGEVDPPVHQVDRADVDDRCGACGRRSGRRGVCHTGF